MTRSNRPEVRNPVLTLPSAQDLKDLPAETRAILRALLNDIGQDASLRAQKCWRTRKAPMAAYWKVVSVYARHIARALR